MGPALNSGLLSMKQLGVLLLPSEWDASPSQGYPQHICWYPFVHLGEEKHSESKVSCLRTQHNNPGRGLEPGPLDPESSALTMRPPHLHIKCVWPSVKKEQCSLCKCCVNFLKLTWLERDVILLPSKQKERLKKRYQLLLLLQACTTDSEKEICKFSLKQSLVILRRESFYILLFCGWLFLFHLQKTSICYLAFPDSNSGRECL